jgi:hypothetical protein
MVLKSRLNLQFSVSGRQVVRAGEGRKITLSMGDTALPIVNITEEEFGKILKRCLSRD